MDEKGNLFDLEITLQNHLKPIEKTSFRELLNKIIYIKPTDEFKNRLGKHFKGIGKDDGFLAYGYIDEEAGLSFKVLSSANIRNNKLSRGLFNEEHEFIIRVGGLKGCEYLDLKYCDVNTSDFDEYINEINETYKCSSKQTEEMRNFEFLDSARHPYYPDDIKVVLFSEQLEPEVVWVKCWVFTENKLYGKLLNEPNQDFGVHLTNIIGFAPVKGDFGIMFAFTGEKLK